MISAPRPLLSDAFVICGERECWTWVRIPKKDYVFIKSYYCAPHQKEREAREQEVVS